jgi:hypothetical protein
MVQLLLALLPAESVTWAVYGYVFAVVGVP